MRELSGVELAVRTAAIDVLNEAIRCADIPDADGFAACFSVDAVWRQGDTVRTGREQIRATVSRRDPGVLIRHLMGAVRFLEIGTERVLVDSHAAILTSASLLRVVDYSDELHRIGDRWHITTRHTTVAIG